MNIIISGTGYPVLQKVTSQTRAILSPLIALLHLLTRQISLIREPLAFEDFREGPFTHLSQDAVLWKRRKNENRYKQEWSLRCLEIWNELVISITYNVQCSFCIRNNVVVNHRVKINEQVENIERILILFRNWWKRMHKENTQCDNVVLDVSQKFQEL